MKRTTDDALVSAVVHLVGQSRAFLHLVEAALNEIDSLHDDRSAQLVESLGLTLREPPAPGTLRHVEITASELLRRLRQCGTL